MYFKVILVETDKEAYICTDDIASIESSGIRSMWIHLKDDNSYFVRSIDYVPETAVDIQDLIRRKDKEKNKVPIEIIEYVKENNGEVNLDIIKDYISTRVFNVLRRQGDHQICYILYGIEQNTIFQPTNSYRMGLGRAGKQEIIDLFLQMDLIERKKDKDYKPFEGYVSKIALRDDEI